MTGGSLSFGNFNVDNGGNLTANNADIKGKITATSGTFRGTIYASGGTFTGSISAASISGGSTLTLGNNTHYLRMGKGTDHPEVSSLNITGDGAAIDFGASYGVYINGNAGEVSRAQTNDSVTISGNNGIYINNTLKICERLDADGTGNFGMGKHGKPKIVTYQTNLGDRRQMVFVNGILVEEKNN